MLYFIHLPVALLKKIYSTRIKGELKPEIFHLHLKVITLIKVKSNVFL